MKTHSGKAKKTGGGRGGCGRGAAAVSVARDSEEGGAAQHAAVALGTEMQSRHSHMVLVTWQRKAFERRINCFSPSSR